MNKCEKRIKLNIKLITYKMMFIIIIALSFSCFIGCTSQNDDPEKENKDIASKDDPSKKTALDNISLVIEKFSNQEYFYIVTTGVVNTKAFLFNYKQNIVNEVRKEKDLLYKESISHSSLKQVGKKMIIDKVGCFIIDAKKVSSITDVKWDSSVKETSYSDYLDLYGANPYGFTGYIINEDTIKTCEMEADGEYFQINITLDPVTAVALYQKEMKEMAGSDEYPSFESITLNVKVNNDWEVIENDIVEKYEIKIPILGCFACVGELHQEYSYLKSDVIKDKDFR